MSRLAKHEKDGVEPSFPPAGAAGYLLEYLHDIGPTIAAGMGDGPITQGEIAAYQSNMGIVLTSWEVGMLRQLSIAHLNQSYLAKEPNCKPPFGELYRNPDVDKRIDAALD